MVNVCPVKVVMYVFSYNSVHMYTISHVCIVNTFDVNSGCFNLLLFLLINLNFCIMLTCSFLDDHQS